MDLSSELVHSLLPLMLVGSLGASVFTVGLLEGLAEATALIVKVFSGAVSDFLGRRKGLLLFGYGLAALTKPMFPLATSVQLVFAARLLDRVGKGIRGAPRDALVADVSPPEIRGAAFGLRQSMDTVGAFLGPLAAVGLMLAYAGNIQSVLWWAVLPALLCLALIVFGVSEPEGLSAGAKHFRSPLSRAALRQFPARYWWLLSVAAVMTLARFSEAFLLLRAQQLGLANTWVPLVMVLMSLAYLLSAYPAGVLSDRLNRAHLLAAGLLILVAADLALAYAGSLIWLGAGVVLWGLHMGLTQGILAAMIADTAPAESKGTAFGLFGFVTGLAVLLASVLAGFLWDHYGAASTFMAGAAISTAAVAMLLREGS